MYKVSIITTVLNAADTIGDCIKSVYSQTVPVEHIIVDGGSTDGTNQIINDKYLSCITKYISEPDKGIYDGMNKGLGLTTGNIIGFLNADDMYAESDILYKVLKVFTDSNVDSCYGNLVYIDPVKKDHICRYWQSSPYNRRSFYWGWMPPHPTFFVQKHVYEKYGCFNLDLGSAADYELMLRFLCKHNITSMHIPEILVKMRVGGVSNASFKSRIKANRSDRLAWKVNDLKPYPWTLILKPLSKIKQFFL